jgi:hypothetical protein
MSTLTCFTADGAYDQGSTYAHVAERHPDAAVIVPLRATAVPNETAARAPTQRDRHLQDMPSTAAWAGSDDQATRGALAEAGIARWQQVIGDGLRSHTEDRRTTEVAVAVHVLNRMLASGRPISVRIA